MTPVLVFALVLDLLLLVGGILQRNRPAILVAVLCLALIAAAALSVWIQT